MLNLRIKDANTTTGKKLAFYMIYNWVIYCSFFYRQHNNWKRATFDPLK